MITKFSESGCIYTVVMLYFNPERIDTFMMKSISADNYEKVTFLWNKPISDSFPTASWYA